MNHAQSQPTFSRVAVEWLASESVRARDYSGLIMHTARVGAFPAHGYLLQSPPKLVTCQNIVKRKIRIRLYCWFVVLDSQDLLIARALFCRRLQALLWFVGVLSFLLIWFFQN